MEPGCRVRIVDQGQTLFEENCPLPLLLGRQRGPEEELYSLAAVPERGGHRFVIARSEESSVSRWHVRLTAEGPDSVRVENLSQTAKLEFSFGAVLAPGGPPTVVALPLTVRLGSKWVGISKPAVEEDGGLVMESLASPAVTPYRFQDRASQSGGLETIGIGGVGEKIEPEMMIRWLQTAMGVLQSAATDSNFFLKAAKAIVEIVGMDAGRVLLVDKTGEWKIEASHIGTKSGIPVSLGLSHTVLKRVSAESRTFWLNPSSNAASGSSLVPLSSVVASPVLDRSGRVIAALYGERIAVPLGGLASSQRAVTKLDAMLLDLLAGSVAAGLARLEQEKEAIRLNTQFEQFFTPELARDLASQPELLEGRDQEITVLFGDIRGFSRMAPRLGPARTLEWINDVMMTLSDCVLNQRGVLVDYIGDEIMAMWGAPRQEPEHALLACQAARDMLNALPSLNQRWQDVLGEPMDLGIGINTGIARVGNTGSKRKFKYGPLGDTVNVASRVQGANKYYRTRILLTKACKEKLPPQLACRRIGPIRAVNLSEPIELYELPPDESPGWAALKASYEEALAEFEARRFREAARALGEMLIRYPNDGPSVVLISRAASSLVEQSETFDPCFPLPGK